MVIVHLPSKYTAQHFNPQQQERGIDVFINKFWTFLKVHFESVLQLNLLYNKYFNLAVFLNFLNLFF